METLAQQVLGPLLRPCLLSSSQMSWRSLMPSCPTYTMTRPELVKSPRLQSPTLLGAPPEVPPALAACSFRGFR